MILDMAGLAQKGGAVMSHLRIGYSEADVTSSRIVNGGADLLLAADEVVGASKDAITLCASTRTTAIVNTGLMPVADFVRNRDFDFKIGSIQHAIAKTVSDKSVFLDFGHIASEVTGDAMSTNILLTELCVGSAACCRCHWKPSRRRSSSQRRGCEGQPLGASNGAVCWRIIRSPCTR